MADENYKAKIYRNQIRNNVSTGEQIQDELTVAGDNLAECQKHHDKIWKEMKGGSNEK